MRGGIPRVYGSYQEFERDELNRTGPVDDMLDEMFAEELDFDEETSRRASRRRAVTED